MIRAQMISGSDGGELLEQALAVREAVFVDEQGYAIELERDEYDALAAHVLIFDGDEPIATGRLYLDGDARWRIGRVAVRKEARGRGVGDLAMRMLMLFALQFQADAIYLGAQEYAVGFYERLGFRVYGDVYLDEGQPHRHMAADRATIETLFQGCDGGCGGDGGCSGCKGCH